MKLRLGYIALAFLLAFSALGAGGQRVHLFPRLHPGQVLYYLIRFRADKNVKAESKVVVPMVPDAAQLDAHGLLRVEILELRPTASSVAVHVRSQFVTLDSGAWIRNHREKKPHWDKELVPADGNYVEFTIASDGSVTDLNGLESLFPEQQQAWLQWAARFALAWTLPAEGVRLSERWRSDEPERSPAPITGLRWTRESTYVKDEPCQPSQLTLEADVVPSSGPPDTCGVLLSTATLKQTSSAKDATPEEYKLRDLHTAGSAKGTGETVTYISRTTGLVVRATEETTQSMEVVVAKSDGSNRVQYLVDAKSHSEVLLITDTPLNQP